MVEDVQCFSKVIVQEKAGLSDSRLETQHFMTFVGKYMVSTGPGKSGEDDLSGSRSCPEKTVPQPADQLECE